MSISINFTSDDGIKTIKLTEVPGCGGTASSMSNIISRNINSFTKEKILLYKII